MKSIIYSSFLFLFAISLNAQVGIGTTTPEAALDIVSTNDGLLIPRVALTDLTTPIVTTPTESELVFNITSNGTVEPGYYYLRDIAGVLTWVRFGGTGWLLGGNDGITNSDFIGSINNADVVFRRFNAEAGRLNSFNTSFGVGALSNVNPIPTGPFPSGIDNVAIGVNALSANIGGVKNIAIGNNALENLNPNSSNGFVGQANIAIGFNTLTAGVPGNDNIAIGLNALTNNRGNQNIGIGLSALQNNTTGVRNTFIGRQAGFLITSGDESVAVGANAMGRGVSTGSANVAVGSFALEDNTTGENNTAIGHGAINRVSSGRENTIIGAGAGGEYIGAAAVNILTTGSNNILIGYRASVPTAATSNRIQIGSGTTQAAFVNAPSWTTTSDRRLKSNIKDSHLGLDFIKTIRPVSYYRNDDKDQQTEFGFIAQELDAALKTSGITNTAIINTTQDGMFAVRYNDFLPITVKAVQEQQVQIEALQKENEELKKINGAILKRLDVLEKKNN